MRKQLEESYNELKDYADKNIIYAGFVDDITLFYKAADMLINPVIDGGGIKTKLVEALGYNMNVVTTSKWCNWCTTKHYRSKNENCCR